MRVSRERGVRGDEPYAASCGLTSTRTRTSQPNYCKPALDQARQFGNSYITVKVSGFRKRYRTMGSKSSFSLGVYCSGRTAMP